MACYEQRVEREDRSRTVEESGHHHLIHMIPGFRGPGCHLATEHHRPSPTDLPWPEGPSAVFLPQTCHSSLIVKTNEQTKTGRETISDSRTSYKIPDHYSSKWSRLCGKRRKTAWEACAIMWGPGFGPRNRKKDIRGNTGKI